VAEAEMKAPVIGARETGDVFFLFEKRKKQRKPLWGFVRGMGCRGVQGGDIYFKGG